MSGVDGNPNDIDPLRYLYIYISVQINKMSSNFDLETRNMMSKSSRIGRSRRNLSLRYSNGGVVSFRFVAQSNHEVALSSRLLFRTTCVFGCVAASTRVSRRWGEYIYIYNNNNNNQTIPNYNVRFLQSTSMVNQSVV